jgi:hypothetical protein
MDVKGTIVRVCGEKVGGFRYRWYRCGIDSREGVCRGSLREGYSIERVVEEGKERQGGSSGGVGILYMFNSRPGGPDHCSDNWYFGKKGKGD